MEDSDLTAPWPTPHGFNPPDDWLEPYPGFKKGQSTIITPEGRVVAWSHPWDVGHIGTTAGGEEKVWYPSPSPSGNKAFHQGSCMTASGQQVDVGVIPLSGGHASKWATAREAQDHYDRPENVRIIARANETEDGCQINGFLVPGTTHAEVGLMRTVGLSGDWRYFKELGDLDYIGPCFVNRQGFPKGVQRLASRVASLPSLYTMEPVYHLAENDEGRLVSVTASAHKIEAVNPESFTMMFEDKYDLTKARTASADEDGSGDDAPSSGAMEEIRSFVTDLAEVVATQEARIAALEAEVTSVEEIDTENPDT